jgi:hypothetical protein
MTVANTLAYYDTAKNMAQRLNPFKKSGELTQFLNALAKVTQISASFTEKKVFQATTDQPLFYTLYCKLDHFIA